MKELLKQLVQAETTPAKGELAAAEVISAELGRSGIDSRIDSWDRTRANIIALVKSAGHKAALLFACHLDVVGPGEAAWEKPAFGAVESDGKIYGRGSADMKGGIAAIVTAISRIVDSNTKLQGDIIFFAAAGEETDSCGAKRFISDSGRLPEFIGVVIPEPTDFEIVTAHRGMLWLEVTTKGKAAHGSTPHLGVNAITSMRSVLDELENYPRVFLPRRPPLSSFVRQERGETQGQAKTRAGAEPRPSMRGVGESHKLLGECSMSINTIAGGKTLNVVPDKCSIGIDIRTLPAQNHQDIITDLENIFAKLKSENSQFDAEVSVLRQVRALETDCRCDFVKDFCSAVENSKTKAVGFTTDGPYFASLGAPVVIFGPGKPQLCHKPDEYIQISDVEKAAEYYKNIILKFQT
ncbi:MAG: M20 family metallopeptidase [Planctomycetota bacterium]